MKLMFSRIRNLRLAASLSLGLSLGNAAWGASLIQSTDVSPSPLIAGQGFTISVTAAPEVTEGTVVVDFHPGATPALEIPLTKQGLTWTASGVAPLDLRLKPQKDEAKLKVTLLDAAHHRDVSIAAVDVNVSTISAIFAGGILTVTGDDQDNALTVFRDAAGTLFALIDGRSLTIVGGTPTIANTTLIRMFGLKGNDVLLVESSNGPMPPAHLLGGEGNDFLTGSASDDELDGGPGDDILLGKGGNDRLIGGPGNDTLTGGSGTDQIFGREGNDLIIWNPGDGNDLVEGESGEDTLVFNGANISEEVEISANGSRLRFFRNIAAITMDCDGIEHVLFRAQGGADKVTISDLTGTQVTQVALDLASPAGSTTGDAAADTIIITGTELNDHITVTESDAGVNVAGLTAAVTLVGAEKNLDKLVIDARGGTDVVDFIGSSTNEVVDLSADGAQLRFFRDVSTILVGCANVEQVNFRALGGAHQVTVNDLTGTPVTKVGLDLSCNTPGTGNGQADTIVVNGTQTNDNITITGSGAGVDITGLTAEVTVVGAEADLDRLVINALGGADIVDASTAQAGAIALTLNGGDGIDMLIGGAGNDVLNGGRGDDVEFGGAGNDTYLWNPGDGSDILDDQSGQDAMIFNGANIAEQIDLSANGQRLRFFRNVGNITMDCKGIESIQFNALGGADLITVRDLTGTDVKNVGLNLAGSLAANVGDSAADTVIVDGTGGSDVVVISGTPATGGDVLGLAASVHIDGSEPALDQLVVNLGDGDDVGQASDLQAGVIQLTIDGGKGADVIVGSAGDDVLKGGEGDDVLTGGPGNDVLDGGTGNNVIIQ